MSKFTPNTPEVVSEVIDGELVAIHLGSGCYYHANKSGSTIWSLMEAGNSLPEIVSQFSEVYSLDNKEAERLVGEFIKKLSKEKLTRKASGKNRKSAKKFKAKKLKGVKFEAPKLKKHTDMKELLLLDPIHDIGDAAMPLQNVE